MSFLLISLVLMAGIQSDQYSKYLIKEQNCEKQDDNNIRKCDYQLEYEGNLDYKNSAVRQQLKGVYECVSDNELNLSLKDSEGLNFELEEKEPYLVDNRPRQRLVSPVYIVDMKEDVFGGEVRTNEGRVFTIDDTLVFSEYYLQFNLRIDNSIRMFGLGERFDKLEVEKNNNYTHWSYDQPMVNGALDMKQQTYGNQAVLLLIHPARHTHTLLLFRTSSSLTFYAQDIPNTSDTSLAIHFIGGVLDLKVFIHQDIQQLMTIYRQFIGPHAVPALWQLGHHQCRWGYKDTTDLQRIMYNYQSHHIPIDTFWTDIDYLDQYKVFTHSSLFKQSDVQELMNKYDKKYIPILDPTLSAKPLTSSNQMYKGLVDGLQMKCFMWDKQQDYPMLSKQWAGPVFVPDFLHPNASIYWHKQLVNLKQQYLYDGLWIDMNEVSNFVNGNYNVSAEVEGLQNQLNHQLWQQERDMLPYMPDQKSVSEKTLNIFQQHYGNVSELYHHNVFNLWQQYETYKSLQKQSNYTKLPFVLSRSNTLNSHKYSFHWTGDNTANYVSMQNSIQEIFRAVLNGIQMVGSDICGFQADSNPTLCARWYQLGSLYPFSRNHNAIYQIDQDPVSLGPLTTLAAKLNLQLRYSLLRYYYLHLLKNKQQNQLIWPLFMFYNDPLLLSTYQELSQNHFMIGDCLLAAPIVSPDTFQHQVYLPQHYYYHLHTGQPYQPNQVVTLYNHYNDLVDLFLRASTILQVQSTLNIQSTKQLSSTISLKIAPGQDNKATGQLLMLGDLYSEHLVIQYCIQQDCTLPVSATLTPTLLSIHFTLTNPTLFYQLHSLQQLVSIAKIHLYSSLTPSRVCYSLILNHNIQYTKCQSLTFTKYNQINVADAPFSFQSNNLRITKN